MGRRSAFVAVFAFALSALPGPVCAQETPKPEAPEAVKPPETGERSADRARSSEATVRVGLVITRHLGERKVASLPYTLVVVTGGGRTRMRMGVDTPIPIWTSTAGNEQASPKPSTSYQYRNVGTNIDCAVWEKRDRQYQLSANVENSSVFSGPDARTAGGGVDGVPLFRRFETAINALVRDGQTIQVIASTDPVTGEVVKIDVTLNVVK